MRSVTVMLQELAEERGGPGTREPAGTKASLFAQATSWAGTSGPRAAPQQLSFMREKEGWSFTLISMVAEKRNAERAVFPLHFQKLQVYYV